MQCNKRAPVHSIGRWLSGRYRRRRRRKRSNYWEAVLQRGSTSHSIVTLWHYVGSQEGWDDWGPRIGIAWRIDPKTTLRGGYGIVYDTTMGMEQDWKGNSGNWPGAGSVVSSIAMNQTGSPLATVESTFGQVGTVLPAADPWSLGNWYMDPHIQDLCSQQYNVTVERELGSNTALSVGYVGQSLNYRLGITGLWNTAQTPGTGTAAQVRARTPFPWYNTSAFYSTSNGTSNYNALQVKLDPSVLTASNIWLPIPCRRPSAPEEAGCSTWRTGQGPADFPFGKTTMT